MWIFQEVPLDGASNESGVVDQGHLKFPFWKSKIPPAWCKNFRKFPLWKYFKIPPIYPACKRNFIKIVIYLPITN